MSKFIGYKTNIFNKDIYTGFLNGSDIYHGRGILRVSDDNISYGDFENGKLKNGFMMQKLPVLGTSHDPFYSRMEIINFKSQAPIRIDAKDFKDIIEYEDSYLNFIGDPTLFLGPVYENYNFFINKYNPDKWTNSLFVTQNMVNEFTDKLTHHVFLKTASDIIGPNCENFKSLSLIFHPDKFTNNKFKQQATQFWHDLNNLYTKCKEKAKAEAEANAKAEAEANDKLVNVNKITGKNLEHLFAAKASDIIGPNCEKNEKLSRIYRPNTFKYEKFRKQATDFMADFNEANEKCEKSKEAKADAEANAEANAKLVKVNKITGKNLEHLFAAKASDIIGPNCENFSTLRMIYHPDKFIYKKFEKQATDFMADLIEANKKCKEAKAEAKKKEKSKKEKSDKQANKHVTVPNTESTKPEVPIANFTNSEVLSANFTNSEVQNNDSTKTEVSRVPSLPKNEDNKETKESSTFNRNALIASAAGLGAAGLYYAYNKYKSSAKQSAKSSKKRSAKRSAKRSPKQSSNNRHKKSSKRPQRRRSQTSSIQTI